MEIAMNVQSDTKLVCDRIYLYPTHKTDQRFNCNNLRDTYGYTDEYAKRLMRKLQRRLVLRLVWGDVVKDMLDMCMTQRLTLTVAVLRKQSTPPHGREPRKSLPPIISAGHTGLPLYYDIDYTPRNEFISTLVLGDVKDLPISEVQHIYDRELEIWSSV